jgi:hypothetical protein
MVNAQTKEPISGRKLIIKAYLSFDLTYLVAILYREKIT